ncbi:MAG: CHAD domain-containing protein [Thiotrichales bacterium]
MNHASDLLGRPAVAAIADLLERQFTIAATQIEAMRTANDPDALHDFRVALRRLRSIAESYPAYGKRLIGRKRLRRLRKLARATNAARDAEVRLHWLEQSVAALPQGPGLNTGCDTLHDTYAVDYHAHFDALRKPLQQRFARLHRRALKRLNRCRAAPAPSFAHVIDVACAGLSEPWLEGLTQLRQTRDPADLHRVRILTKRLRYLVEPVAAELPQVAPLLRHCKYLQDALGDLHDLHLRADDLLQKSERSGSRIFHRMLSEILCEGMPLERLETAAVRPSIKGVLLLAQHLAGQIESRYAALAERPIDGAVERVRRDLDQLRAALGAISTAHAPGPIVAAHEVAFTADVTTPTETTSGFDPAPGETAEDDRPSDVPTRD